ncbi:MAG: ABC transporter permease, partial [Myxococcales bacterium]
MTYVTISAPRLLLALCLIAVAVVLSRRSRLGLEKDLVWGAIRGAAQLIAIGYALVLLFDLEHPAWVLLLLGVMLTAAGATAARRVEHGPAARVLFPRATVAIGVGA